MAFTGFSVRNVDGVGSLRCRQTQESYVHSWSLKDFPETRHVCNGMERNVVGMQCLVSR